MELSTPLPTRVYYPIPTDAIDPDVVRVLRRLRRFQFEAYLVGGCVRDLLLGVCPKDFDVATGARPRDIRRLFRNSKVIGRRFRLVRVFFRGGKVIEVATFRRAPAVEARDQGSAEEDLLITDDNLFGTPAEDARRRDFTINGLFYDLHSREIVDHVSGLSDIEARVLRSIGDPEIRIQEDPVRILRAIKFSSRLDLSIDDALWDAMVRHCSEIHRSAAPRVLEEVLRMLRSPCVLATVSQMQRSGILEILLPEVHCFLGPAGQAAPICRAEGGGLAMAAPQERFFSASSEASRLIRDSQAARSGRAQAFWRLLGLLDERMSSHGVPPDCMLLAALLYLPLRERIQCSSDTSHDLGQVISELVGPLAQRLELPRRMTEQVKQVLASEQRLSGSTRRSPRRRTILRRPRILESLLLYELGCLLRGDPTDRARNLMALAYAEAGGDRAGTGGWAACGDSKADERAPPGQPRSSPRRRRPRKRPRARPQRFDQA